MIRLVRNLLREQVPDCKRETSGAKHVDTKGGALSRNV